MNKFLQSLSTFLWITCWWIWLPTLKAQNDCSPLFELHDSLTQLSKSDVTSALSLELLYQSLPATTEEGCDSIKQSIELTFAFLHYQRTDYQLAFELSQTALDILPGNINAQLEHWFYAFWAGQLGKASDLGQDDHGEWIRAFSKWTPSGTQWQDVEAHFHDCQAHIANYPLRLQLEYYIWRAQNLMYSTSERDLTRAKTFLQYGLVLAIEHDDVIHEIWLRYQLGFWGRQMGNPKIYEEQFEAVLQLNDQIQLWPKDHPFRIRILNALALASESNGDLATAITLIDETIQYHQRRNNVPRVLRRQLNKAKILSSMGLLDSCRALYESILPSLRIQGQSETVHIVLNNLGEVYKDLKLYDQAIQAHSESLELKIREQGLIHEYVAISHLNLSSLYTDRKDYPKAKGHLESCLEILSQLRKTKGTIVSRANRQLGEIMFANAKYEEALSSFEKAADALLVDDLAEEFPERAKYISAPQQFVDVQARIAEMHPFVDRINPGFADSIFRFCIDYLETIRLDFDNNQAKKDFQEFASKVYDRAISFRLESSDLADVYSRIPELFELFEKAKSYDLRTQLQSETLHRMYGIADSIKSKEYRLQNQLLDLNKRLNDSSPHEANDTMRHRLSQILLEQKNFQSMIRRTKPDYYQEMYTNTVATVSELQSGLQEEETWLNFHLLDTLLLCIEVNRSGKHLLHQWNVPFDFKAKINTLLGLIRSKDPQLKMLINELSQPYFSWMGEICEGISPHTNIIIEPHGALATLPFDMMLLRPVENMSSPRNIPYVISKYDVTYRYSAESVKTMPIRKPTYLGVAPVCCEEGNHRREELLTFTDDEILLAGNLFASTIQLGSSATKHSFLEQAPKHDIIHLATHGYIDHENPLYNSRLSFHKTDTTLAGDLYVHELYGTEFSSQLAVLSACNSATGQYDVGNGVVGLARGFGFAGCRNIVQTLWSIDDQVTAMLVGEFFARAKRGVPLGQALSQAKRQYIASVPPEQSELLHPFYWSGFIMYGPDVPIVKRAKIPNPAGMTVLAGLIIALIVGFVYWKRTRRI